MGDIIDLEPIDTDKVTLAYARDDYCNGLNKEEVIQKYSLPKDFDFSKWVIKDSTSLNSYALEAKTAKAAEIADEYSEEAILASMLKYRKRAVDMTGKLLNSLDKQLGQELTLPELAIAASIHTTLLKAVTPETPKGVVVNNNTIGSLTAYATSVISNAEKDC